MIVDEILKAARELATPADWSRAVEFARNGEFLASGQSKGFELEIRTVGGFGKAEPRRIVIDSADSSWQCDCSDDDPCVHVLATLIAIKQEKVRGLNGAPQAREQSTIAHIVHVLKRYPDNLLGFERQL